MVIDAKRNANFRGCLKNCQQRPVAECRCRHLPRLYRLAKRRITLNRTPSITSITATSPADSGVVDMTVTTAGDTGITVIGTGFTGATAVEFGSTATASFTVDRTPSVTATAPAAA
jgi:hypothetical protein